MVLDEHVKHSQRGRPPCQPSTLPGVAAGQGQLRPERQHLLASEQFFMTLVVAIFALGLILGWLCTGLIRSVLDNSGESCCRPRAWNGPAIRAHSHGPAGLDPH